MTEQKTLNKIAVYCGSSAGKDPAYLALARDLGHELVKRDYGMVYGGGDVGLMGAIAHAMIDQDGAVTGIIPQFLMDAEVGLSEGIELKIVPDMHVRKNTIVELSDGFIAMPGGFGTFEEIFEVLTWSQLGLHDKPCALLNVSGYYDALIEFIDNAIAQGFIHPSNRALFVVADNPTDLLDQMEAFKHPAVDKIAFSKD